MNIGSVTKKGDLIEALEKLRTERENNRKPFETQWWNNIALISGDHYAEWDPMRADYVQQAKEDWRVRLVLNQARVMVRTELAKVVKARPVMEVIPQSMDEEDISAAKVGNFALAASEWKFKLKKKRKHAFWWTSITGMSAIYVGYDGNDSTEGKAQFVLDPATNEPTFDDARVEEIKQMVDEGTLTEMPIEEWPVGELEFRSYTPFQLLPDDTVLEWDDIKDLITTDIVEMEVAKDTWPDAAKELNADRTPAGNISTRLLRRAGMTTDVGVVAPAEDVVRVYTYWLPPNTYQNKFLRDGIMVRWDGQQILEFSEEFPFSDGRIPFAFFTHTPNATSIWPDCIVTDIRPINLELNKTISQLLENRDFMLNPMWRIPEQTQVRKIKSQPGGEIRYTAIPNLPPPEPIPGTPMPTQIENLVVGLRDQILDISGQGEVSRGRLPSGVRSGIQVAYLQEEDETKLGPISENFEDGISIMGSMTLERYSQFYTTERLMKNYKPGGQADVRRFKGADLKGNTDVVTQAGSALPRLKAARQQFILQLAELGIEKDPKKIKDMLELGEGVPDAFDMSKAQAMRENEIIRNGSAVAVEKWHNHQLHNQEHYAYMMSTEYEAMVQSDDPEDPVIVRLFTEHTAMHEKALQELQMQQLKMMIAARGGPDSAAPTDQFPLDSQGPPSVG